MINGRSAFSIFIFLSVVAAASADVYHCFNDLVKFTPLQIRRIHSLSIDQVSKTSPAKQIFSCYLKETRLNGVKSDIEKYFDIYKKCDEFKTNRITQISENQIEEFANMGLPLYLQNYLVEHIKLTNGNQVVNYTQNELSKKIELSQPYIEYKALISKYQAQYENKQAGQSSLFCTFTLPINILLTAAIAKLLT